MSKKAYCDIFQEHAGFLSDKWTHYLFIYDILLSKFIEAGKPVTLLEIGVQNGGSLENWKKYLPEGSRIYGIDIDPLCNKLKFSDGITFFLGSGADKKFTDEVLGDLTFDIILDDASHRCRQVIRTFQNLFSKVNPGGMFIVEDIHTSYWHGKFGGGLRKKRASMEFFKRITDAMNYDHFRRTGWCSRAELAKLKAYNEVIGRVSFFDSVCAIEKYHCPKTKPFIPVTTGSVTAVRGNANQKMENVSDEIREARELFFG